jgi:5-methylcytosine-specific restriction endonuclease McrA
MTTKICCACHQTKPLTEFYRSKGEKDGYEYCCKACHNARTYRWRAMHPERVRENARKFARQERVRIHRQKYAREHREIFRKSMRKHRSKHLAEYREKSRAYQKAHPEYFRRKVQERKAKILSVGGSYTEEEWHALCKRFGNICLCCKKKKPLTIDHVVPICKGGSNTIDNIQPLCLECNQRKHNRIIDYRL